MICDRCAESGEISKVYPGGGTVTLMACQPFYDEAGIYHNHDSNTSTYAYSCSNGHRWLTKGHGSCPAPDCDFKAIREITYL